jgi:6-phosphogluconolactonase
MTAIRSVVLSFVPVLAAAATAAVPAPAEWMVYIGTYTGAKARGIYLSRFDATTGRLAPAELATESENPSFLALHPTRPLLYAVNEIGTFEGESAGSVSAFAVEAATGRLTLINRSSSKGGGPCHLTVDRTGRNVLVANYGGGSVASLPIRPDGGLAAASAFVQHHGSSADPQRQKGPHGHAVELDKANRIALVADLGLDRVLVYRFDPERGSLDPADPPFAALAPGAGPRHLAFGRDGRHVYVLNEMHLTVTVFGYDAGRLREVQTVSTRPAGTKPGADDSGAEVQLHPGGRFLYTSNRGPDSITVFSIDPASGRLTRLDETPTGGRTPRNFAVDPTGRFLLAANQNSDRVVVFRIDAETGRLTPTAQAIEVGAPVCVVFRQASSR